jgi:hypothetical protein
LFGSGACRASPGRRAQSSLEGGHDYDYVRTMRRRRGTGSSYMRARVEPDVEKSEEIKRQGSWTSTFEFGAYPEVRRCCAFVDFSDTRPDRHPVRSASRIEHEQSKRDTVCVYFWSWNILQRIRPKVIKFHKLLSIQLPHANCLRHMWWQCKN